jgi:hypothetical protein
MSMATETIINLVDVVPGVPFAQQLDEIRMAILHIIDDLGGDSHGYIDGGITVAVPREIPAKWNLVRTLEICGLRAATWAYFPLGTDNPPDSLRHDGSYPGSKGFWLFCHFTTQPEGN